MDYGSFREGFLEEGTFKPRPKGKLGRCLPAEGVWWWMRKEWSWREEFDRGPGNTSKRVSCRGRLSEMSLKVSSRSCLLYFLGLAARGKAVW